MEGLARLLLGQPLLGTAAQLAVDERQQFTGRAGVAVLDAGQFTALETTRLSWRRREICALRSDRPERRTVTLRASVCRTNGT
jgi:hypothetical protein